MCISESFQRKVHEAKDSRWDHVPTWHSGWEVPTVVPYFRRRRGGGRVWAGAWRLCGSSDQEDSGQSPPGIFYVFFVLQRKTG